MSQNIWTIGHSTRSIQEFLNLLKAHGIHLLVDVRVMPYARRYPQFNTTALAQSTREAVLQYQAFSVLVGRRKPLPNSSNVGWKNLGFRGYADYMLTEQFCQGLEQLTQLAEQQPTTIMCAEPFLGDAIDHSLPTRS